jgi:hypothetical protein
VSFGWPKDCANLKTVEVFRRRKYFFFLAKPKSFHYSRNCNQIQPPSIPYISRKRGIIKTTKRK